jgi:fluoride ion exporter CrcB/FEX
MTTLLYVYAVGAVGCALTSFVRDATHPLVIMRSPFVVNLLGSFLVGLIWPLLVLFCFFSFVLG